MQHSTFIAVADLLASSFAFMKDLPVRSNDNFAPHVALLAVQLMFGSAPILGKFALTAFPSSAIVGFRVGGAALAFFLLQRFRGNLHLEKRRHYFQFAMLSLFGVVLNQLLFFKGLSLTTATNTSLLAVMIPVFAILVSAAIGNDKLTWIKVFGVLLACAGVIYLIDPTKASFSSETTQGDVLIILNCFSYATYIAVSKRIINHYGALKSIAWIFLFGSIINVPFGFLSLSTVDLTAVVWQSWLALAAIVTFPTILAYYWNTWALARVEPSIVAVYIYLQPLIGTLLAIFVLGEAWKPRIFLAMALIFTGVFLVTRTRQREVISKI
ncbi:MAG TPA: DMT family transporter [Pyrinomonadaceae bacterium]|nr:DMT family transporter [Pyrinomonadaceae bacterium]